MKIWRCDFYDPDEGCCVSWHPSKVEAQRYLREQQRERGEEAGGPEGIELVAIPTDKLGLINWLNRHFDTDNG